MTYRKLLKQINIVGDKLKMRSISADDLITIPNKSDKIRAMYITLQAKGFIEIIYNHNSKILFIERLPECMAYKFDSSLNVRDKWKERIVGFIFGVLATIISWIITERLLPLIL